MICQRGAAAIALYYTVLLYCNCGCSLGGNGLCNVLLAKSFTALHSSLGYAPYGFLPNDGHRSDLNAQICKTGYTTYRRRSLQPYQLLYCSPPPHVLSKRHRTIIMCQHRSFLHRPAPCLNLASSFFCWPTDGRGRWRSGGD